MGKCLFMRKGETHSAPSGGIKASDLAVGSSVYLNENGSPVEYLIVNQGIPSDSNLYDASCNGTWLLRKDIYEKRQWHSSDKNYYAESDAHAFLNNDFLNRFDSDIQNTIRTALIPYAKQGNSINPNSGADGLETKVFLLSCSEVFPTINAAHFVDGAILEYFTGGSSAEVEDSKRIAYLNGTASSWWLRSPNKSINAVTNSWLVQSNGASYTTKCSNSYGIRPALILPFNAKFDEKTLQFKGVA